MRYRSLTISAAVAAQEQFGLRVHFSVDDGELAVLPAETSSIAPTDPKDKKAWFGRPLAIVAEPFAGVRHQAEVNDGTLELPLPRRVFLERQRHRAGVERGHVGPRADVASGHERIELGTELANAEGQASPRRVCEERRPAKSLQEPGIHRPQDYCTGT